MSTDTPGPEGPHGNDVFSDLPAGYQQFPRALLRQISILAVATDQTLLLRSSLSTGRLRAQQVGFDFW